ncbi:MAG: cadmium-translocating P-type ATPase [Eubacterium sp.]|nr:cadmium-translocating P-type ATPase [Eubacterium sp.]
MTKKQKKDIQKIIVAGILFAVFIIVEHVTGIGRWGMFALFLIPYLIVGLSVLRNAVRGIGHGQIFDESFLMTLATIGAFVVGENAEAVAVMLFYQVGEFFQSYAVGKSRKSISALMELAPEYANLEAPDGTFEKVDPEEVPEGSVLVLLPGERIPIDGIVVEGESLINTAAMTGEPIPQNVRPGSAVISGCINGETALRIRTTRCYEDSTVAKVLDLVENASARKSRTENFITRFARYYTPVVVIGALLLAIVPSVITGSWGTWILRACTFLVISCPCALVISVPLSFFGGIGAASRNGILVKGSNYLEMLTEADTIITDKTGTLTKGIFAVQKLLPAGDVTAAELLRTAAIAEQMSDHPIAVSVREAFDKDMAGTETLPVLKCAENHSGEGVVGYTENECILAGNAKLLKEAGVTIAEEVAETATVIYVAAASNRDRKEFRYLGAILIADEIKEEAKEAAADMKATGIRKIVMLTGDRKETAESVAKTLGIDEAKAGLLPADKVEETEKLLQTSGKNHRVIYIGDGINDAPVLARADVGIAMGSLGSDAAIEAADIVIMDDDLRKVPAALRIAKKTLQIARQNIVFALGVKILILLLGACGLANMWAAVFADVGVAVIAILNAMRTMGMKSGL